MSLQRWLRSLGGRIMLVTVGVACVAVLITTVVSLQLLTVLVTGQARSALAAQTSALSQQPLASLRALMQDDKILGAHGERFLLIVPVGKVLGAVGAEVKRTMIGVLGSDRSASTAVHVGGDTYVVEGRPRPGGGGLVGFLRVADVTESSPHRRTYSDSSRDRRAFSCRAGLPVLSRPWLETLVGWLAANVASSLCPMESPRSMTSRPP